MHPYLLPVLEHSPLIFERILESTPQNRWDEHTQPHRFSLREALAHMADWEPIIRGRIEAGVANPGAEVQGIDEGERAIEKGYKEWDPRESVATFKKERAITAEFLRNLKPKQWDSYVMHNERGRLGTYDHANMLLGHDLYHIEHATQYMGAKLAATW